MTIDAPWLPGQIRQALPEDAEQILTLISSLGLPVAGVRDHLAHFLILESDGRVTGTVGLELYGPCALLRSLAVSPRFQGKGEGRRLCGAILDHARDLGVEEIVLLTETAASFFEKFGFRTAGRTEVPEAVRASVEFTSACPVSATCMRMPVPPRRA